MKKSPDGRSSRCLAPTRRTVLRAGLGSLGVAAGGSSVAFGQETATATDGGDGTLQAIIPEQQAVEEDLESFWIQIGPTVNPLQAAVDDECQLIDWGDEDTFVYDVYLIDTREDPEAASISLYLPESADVNAGMLFSITGTSQCQSGYRGISIEQVGAAVDGVSVRTETTPETDAEATETAEDDAGATDTEGGEGVIIEDGTRLVNGVIPEQQRLDQEVTGFFIQLLPEVDATRASVDDECDFVSWNDDETRAYDAQLIDKTADPEVQPITLYVHERVDVVEGMLFIVNQNVPCQSGYLGVRLEQIGMDIDTIRARGSEGFGTATTADEGGDGDANADEGGGAEGPIGGAGSGFGVAGALAGLTGAGWLLRQRDGD